MFIRMLLSLTLCLACAVQASAQFPWQFRWQKGQQLTYRIKHVTTATEVVEASKLVSSAQLELVNRWQVLDLDEKGVATLSLTLVSMRNEQKRGNGEAFVFDSENLDKSTPELRDQMKKYIGQTVAVLRVDGYGRVVEVKQGSAASYEAEPPFLVVFPDAKAAEGQAWRRPFNLVLEPPYGTGEKLEADQRYVCKSLVEGKATLGVSTTIKSKVDNSRDRLPLLQREVEGDLVVDLANGRLLSARLIIDRTVENHQGKGSSYRFQSDYTRQLVQ